ncbi:3-demethylubiquinone-9 3-methyltransferase [Rosistilla carotiformis]|uniref:3-demethylubiquinone-9 3-methyltransferase n=1 Tax=Rosistilla carotiformis TaxID=2528017 RepID=A0A518JLV5_9BACT|nr:VOC family protein [Rosistilla carotiformis]QDV66514.1 3-demethylubiquinone-9 3-methyltransferase [Rosistilla carotiformis]
MQIAQKITPFLSFENCAEAAANFYVSVIPNSKIVRVLKHPAEGNVLTVDFELAGMAFVALNTGQPWQFTPAFSMSVGCDSQEEIDRLWSALSEGGAEVQCGWLTDRFGLSWQIVPAQIGQWINDPDPAVGARVLEAVWQMTKLDMNRLQAIYEGK